jgi:hypothetical protein
MMMCAWLVGHNSPLYGGKKESTYSHVAVCRTFGGKKDCINSYVCKESNNPHGYLHVANEPTQYILHTLAYHTQDQPYTPPAVAIDYYHILFPLASPLSRTCQAIK